jgi:site-specific DNA recombinase
MRSGQLEEFGRRMIEGLEGTDWSMRREIIRALVKRIEVGEDGARIVYRVSPSPFEDRPRQGLLLHCWGRTKCVIQRSLMRRSPWR